MHYYTKLAKSSWKRTGIPASSAGRASLIFRRKRCATPDAVDGGKTNVKGCCAADKIVGKAAALLYVGLGVREVYASVMSRRGEETLKNTA